MSSGMLLKEIGELGESSPLICFFPLSRIHVYTMCRIVLVITVGKNVLVSKLSILLLQPSPPSFTPDFFATPGVCGLLNLGNTCYMNAGLQCVFGVEQIAKFYLSKPFVCASYPTSSINSIVNVACNRSKL